jgi:hypothetical protein
MKSKLNQLIEDQVPGDDIHRDVVADACHNWIHNRKSINIDKLADHMLEQGGLVETPKDRKFFFEQKETLG